MHWNHFRVDIYLYIFAKILQRDGENKNDESGLKKLKRGCKKHEDIWISSTIFTHSKSSFLLNEKMGQWPIFSGASLLLLRLVLPSLIYITPSLSLSLWAFELIRAGRIRCLIGHEVRRGAAPSPFLSSPNPVCQLTFDTSVFQCPDPWFKWGEDGGLIPL